MKILMLMRHGHANDEKDGSDETRDLNEIGRKEAHDMGRWLLAEKINPNLIISSPANRALQTARELAEIIAYNAKNIRIEQGVYRTDADELMDILRSQEDKYESILLVGHNPPISELAMELSREITDTMVPAEFVLFESDANSWADFDAHPIRLVRRMQPKSAGQGQM